MAARPDTKTDTETKQEPVEGRKPLSPRTARRAAAAEGVLYGAAGITAALGPQLDVLPLHVGAVTVGAGALWRLWHRSRDHDPVRLLASCQRALPLLGLSGAYSAALLAPGNAWWEYALPAVVAGAAAVAAPLTRSRTLASQAETLPAVIADQAATLPGPTDPYTAGLVRLWAASPATGDTTLTAVQQYHPDRQDFEAVILAPVGQAVPDSLRERTVAAVFDVPEAAVDLAEIPGAGPGRLAVRVAPSIAARRADQALTPTERVRQVWAEAVASQGGAAPGMHLVQLDLTEDRLRLLVEAEDRKMVRLPRQALTRALRPLGVRDPELVMVETDGLASGVVTVYREHPLIHIRQATTTDLTMTTDGQIVLGLAHDGRPAPWQLYDPELGAVTDLVVGGSGSGKSVTLNHLLAAERISGIVSLVADAQDGMSLPEAIGRVAHVGAGIAALGATLSAACAVADYRQEASASIRWGGFEIGDPWPLVNVTLDEINLVLGSDAEVPREFRKWVTGMIGRIQHTGRKMGVGIRFAGQQVHVTDLGSADKVRAGAKRGNVWLGRVDSSMTARMAADMVTDGTEITPIPKYFGSAADDLDAAWTGKTAPRGPLTAGRAWLLQGGRATSMRTFRADKENRTFPGLIALYESAPIPQLTPPEAKVFADAYEVALAAAESLLAGEPQTGEEDQDEETGGGGSARSVHLPPRALADRIADALAAGPLRTREIRAAVGVGEPDGPSSGSVDNCLSRDDQFVRVAHGTWALATQTEPTS